MIKNTNLRYHISKELEKHRTLLENKKRDDVSPFIAPIASAIASISLSVALAYCQYRNYPVSAHVIIYALSPPICFILIYAGYRYVLKPAACKWYNWIHHRIFKNVPDRCAITEHSVHKFNYEIFNLGYLAYNLSREQDQNHYTNRYNTLESIFYLSLSIDKTNELNCKYKDIIGKRKIHKSRMKFYCDICRETLKTLEQHNADKDLPAEFEDLKFNYNSLIQALNEHYAVELELSEH